MDYNVPTNKAFYKATHNSYSGGRRGSLTEQLDQGVRLIELDINYVPGSGGTRATFVVGHGDGGAEVYHGGGNPTSNDLEPWLSLLRTWVTDNPGLAPITVVLDCKDDLTTDPEAYKTLDDMVTAGLGTAIYPASSQAGGIWPTVAELLGRFLVVLSGNLTTRLGYAGRKLMFVESQYRSGSKEGDVKGAYFWAADATKKADATWAKTGLDAGKLVRLWGFTQATTEYVVTFPATDAPYEPWYVSYAAQIGALDAAVTPPPVEPKVSWGKSHDYDKGLGPSVAVNNNGVAVEVHKSQNDDKLWCTVGAIDPETKLITWGKSHSYDSGVAPRVALDDDGNVVEAHQSQKEPTLWYHVGKVDTKSQTITFGPSHKYDKGVTPSIAMDGLGNVVEVHQSQNEETLWYSAGPLDVANKKIHFGDSHKYDKGITPSVAMAPNGDVVEIHQSQNEDTLWTRVGKLKMSDKTVGFAPSQRHDKGVRPSIALHRDGDLLEVHQSQNEDTLWYALGKIEADKQGISWAESHNYDDGIRPACALAGEGVTVDVHQSQNEETLWYHVGKIIR